MYQPHRGPVPGSTRLDQLLDEIKQEFTQNVRPVEGYEQTITAQLQEMESVRQRLIYLEQMHNQFKQKYDEDVGRLSRELELRAGSGIPHQVHPAQPSQPPPNIGHGTNNLFGQIMTQREGQNPAGLPPQDPQQPGPQQIPQPIPQHPQQVHGAGSAMQANQPNAYAGFQPAPLVNGYGSQPPPPHPAASPAPNRNGQPFARPGPATPQQGAPVPYADARASPRPIFGQPPQPYGATNNLASLQLDLVPSSHKKQANLGSEQEWHAVWRTDVPKQVDVELMQHLHHNSVVCVVRFDHQGSRLATGCNRSAQIYDVWTGRTLAVLRDDSADKEGDLYIRSVAFSHDGVYLATGAEDKLIRVWDIERGQIATAFPGHESDIYSLDFTRTGSKIVSGSGDKSVRIWNMHTRSMEKKLDIEDGVTTVALSRDGRFLAAGSLDRGVRVWNFDGYTLHDCLTGDGQGHTDSVYSVAFSPDGNRVVSGSLDKTIKIWDISIPRQGRCIQTLSGHNDFVLSVALTPDGRYVMSGSKDRGVQFWDTTTGQAQLMLQGHKNSVISVAPSPNGREMILATGSGDHTAKMWRYTYLNA